MRVVTGAFSHESSTFTPLSTGRAEYESRFGYLRGEQMLTTFRDTNTPVGGFIEGAEGIADADGHILRALRDTVGDHVPIVGQLDIQTNMSAQMIECADVLIVRETYPEVDQAARWRECADVTVRIVRDGLQPAMRACYIPMMWGMNQVTADAPMRETIERLHAIEARPGIVCASVATCFPLSDVPCMGASVTVVSEDNADLAQACADELGAWIYEPRVQWYLPRRSTQQVLEQVEADGMFPVILADRDDNTGGGSPGDSTGMLQVFVDSDLQDACILYIVDVESVAICHSAGAGAQVDLQVGGKSAPIQGQPVPMQAQVVAISDGQYHYDGPMYAGLEASMGPSAHIEQDGLHVLLVSIREQPFDTAFCRTLALDPREMRYIGVKSAAHFRSGFESWAGAVHLVAEPSVHSPCAVQFHNLGRRVFPLDEQGRFDPALLTAEERDEK